MTFSYVRAGLITMKVIVILKSHRDKNQELKNTYLIKKSSNLIEFSHSHPVNILKGKLLPERETNFKIREEIFLILLLISILN